MPVALYSHAVHTSVKGTDCMLTENCALQDTLYYLPVEAHALGWQQQGLADRFYAHSTPSKIQTTAHGSSLTSAQQPADALFTGAGQISKAAYVDSSKRLPPSAAVAAQPRQHAETTSQGHQGSTSASTQMHDAESSTADLHQGSYAGAKLEQDSAAPQCAASFQLPEPFVQRPRVGSRLFVQSHFPGIAAALAAEMVSWQTDMRIR